MTTGTATIPATSHASSSIRTPPPSVGKSARSNTAWVRNGVRMPSPLEMSTASTMIVSEPRYGVNRAHTRRPSCSSEPRDDTVGDTSGAAVMTEAY